MFEECGRVGVQEVIKPPDSICGAVCAVVVVPTGYLALIFIAAHVRGDAEY